MSIFCFDTALAAAVKASDLSIENLVPTEAGYEIYVHGRQRPLIIDNATEFSEGALKALKSSYRDQTPISLFIDGNEVLSVDSVETETGQVRPGVNDDDIGRLLKLNQSQNFWTRGDQRTDKVSAFIQRLQSLPSHGIDVSFYKFQTLADQFNNSQIATADFEREFTREAIRLAQDLSSGRVMPESVASDIKFRWKGFSDLATLQRVLTSLPADAWDQLAPKNSYYLDAKVILNRLQEAKDLGQEFEAIKPASVRLRVGSVDPSVKKIKEVLNVLGFNLGLADETFNAKLSDAIKTIQTANLTKATGDLNPTDAATWEFFSHSLDSRISQAALTLEKTRWLPDVFPAKFMVVNLAEQRLRIQDTQLNPESTLAYLANQKTINGRTDRKTPSMADRITHVILNPTWTVPDGIFEKDKIPLLTNMYKKAQSTQSGEGGSPEIGAEKVATYLGTHGYRLLTRDLKGEINPLEVNWGELTSDNAQFVIRQDARFDNVLGLVKFQMTNAFNIYMHDTNERHFFALPNRLKSSGCIRVQHPIDLAEYALNGVADWNRTKIDETLATKNKVGVQTWVRLPTPIPVYTISLTAQLKDDVILFTRDLYRQNLALQRRLTASGY